MENKNIAANDLSQRPNMGKQKSIHESAYKMETKPEICDIEEITGVTFTITSILIDGYQW